MAEDFSLDSLLEDLDAAVVHSPSGATSPAAGGTVRFVPHPPPKNVSQGTVYNPKNRFAVQPGSGSTSPDGPTFTNFGANANINGAVNRNQYFGASVQHSNNAHNAQDPDENSLDNLLNLMNSPQQSRPIQSTTSNIKPSSPNNNITYQGFDNPKAYAGFGQNMSNKAAPATFANNVTNSTAAMNHNLNGGTTLEVSGFSSPFDSPSSHGSASTGAMSATRKTHAGGILSSHSDSSYNFDALAPNKDRSAAVFPAATFASPSSSSGGDATQKRMVGNNNTAGSLLLPIGGSESNCSNTYANNSSSGSYNNNNNGNKNRSGTGVSGGLFGKADANTANKSNLQDIMSNSSSTVHSNGNGSGHSTQGTATSSSSANKGNTVTFTSQQKQSASANTPFLPPSINSTTVVSSSSNSNNQANSIGGGAGAGASSFSSATSAPAANGSKARCTRVIIAGSAMARGRKSSAFAQLACNNLRCLQCNFKVHCFANSAWDGTVDYMFLRNTVPNEVKLATKLQRSAESCAYCCQCSHTSESGERELTAQASNGEPQWVCAGH